MTTSLTLAVAMLLTGPLSDAASSRHATVEDCLVSLIDFPDIPAEDAGKLITVSVDDGDLVKEGQLLAQIDDQEARLRKYAAEKERDAALTKASDQIDVEYAIASFQVADAELQQNVKINEQTGGTGVPVSEIRRLQLTRHRAELQIEKSKLDQKISKLTAEVQNAAVHSAEEQIERRRVIAPFDGIVMKVYRQSNEWVNAGEPIVQVVRMDQLRVEGFISARDYNAYELKNRQVTVIVELARGRMASFAGKVVFVNPLIQAGNKLRIRADVQNRQEQGEWLLRPGMTATMRIHLVVSG